MESLSKKVENMLIKNRPDGLFKSNNTTGFESFKDAIVPFPIFVSCCNVRKGTSVPNAAYMMIGNYLCSSTALASSLYS